MCGGCFSCAGLGLGLKCEHKKTYKDKHRREEGKHAVGLLSHTQNTGRGRVEHKTHHRKVNIGVIFGAVSRKADGICWWMGLTTIVESLLVAGGCSSRWWLFVGEARSHSFPREGREVVGPCEGASGESRSLWQLSRAPAAPWPSRSSDQGEVMAPSGRPLYLSASDTGEDGSKV